MTLAFGVDALAVPREEALPRPVTGGAVEVVIKRFGLCDLRDGTKGRASMVLCSKPRVCVTV